MFKLLKIYSVRKSVRSMSKKGKTKNNNEQKSTVKEEEPVFLDKSKNVIILILAKPGAKQNAITGISSEGVGVQINAPPTDGEANTELIKYISSVLKLRKSDISLEKGFKSRNKTLKINCDLSVEYVKQRLFSEINS